MQHSALLTTIHYEILSTWRSAFDWVMPLLFFLIVVCIFPLALGPETQLLKHIAPGIIWVAALLAILLSIGQLFKDDVEDGFFDIVSLSPNVYTFVCGKIIAHWLLHCLPFVLLSPLLGLLFDFNWQEISALSLSLLLGTPVLCLLGAVGAALTVRLRHSGLLLPLLIIPLYIPVLIFGTSAIMAASLGLALSGYYAILGALVLFSFTFAPWLVSAALRIGVSQ